MMQIKKKLIYGKISGLPRPTPLRHIFKRLLDSIITLEKMLLNYVFENKMF